MDEQEKPSHKKKGGGLLYIHVELVLPGFCFLTTLRLGPMVVVCYWIQNYIILDLDPSVQLSINCCGCRIGKI